MDVLDHTSIPDGFKLCSRHAACVHSLGPVLAATPEFFYRDKNRVDGFRVECKACFYKSIGREYRVKEIIPDGYRRCAAGNECLAPDGPIFPATAEYFFRDPLSNDGMRSRCKRCHVEKTRGWQQKHPERLRELSRKSRTKQRALGFKRKRTRVAASQRTQHSRRAARKRDLPATFTNVDWKYALEYFHGGCAYCGHSPSLFDTTLVLHQEHHIPIVRGGGYTPSNILPACQNCNLKKSAQEPHDWLVNTFGSRRTRQIESKIKSYFSTVRKDGLDCVPRKYVTNSERAALRREEFAKNPPIARLCRRGKQCTHPEGPELPFAPEYFARDSARLSGLSNLCKVCKRNDDKRRAEIKQQGLINGSS